MANQKKQFTIDITVVGKKLRSLREQHGYTQEDLSEFLEMTRSGYASIEKGTYGTRADVLARITLFWYKNEGIRLNMNELIGLDKFMPLGNSGKDDSNELQRELFHLRKENQHLTKIGKLLEKENKKLEESAKLTNVTS